MPIAVIGNFASALTLGREQNDDIFWRLVFTFGKDVDWELDRKNQPNGCGKKEFVNRLNFK